VSSLPPSAPVLAAASQAPHSAAPPAFVSRSYTLAACLLLPVCFLILDLRVALLASIVLSTSEFIVAITVRVRDRFFYSLQLGKGDRNSAARVKALMAHPRNRFLRIRSAHNETVGAPVVLNPPTSSPPHIPPAGECVSLAAGFCVLFTGARGRLHHDGTHLHHGLRCLAGRREPSFRLGVLGVPSGVQNTVTWSSHARRGELG
jgi:hypothetical protein